MLLLLACFSYQSYRNVGFGNLDRLNGDKVSLPTLLHELEVDLYYLKGFFRIPKVG